MDLLLSQDDVQNTQLRLGNLELKYHIITPPRKRFFQLHSEVTTIQNPQGQDIGVVRLGIDDLCRCRGSDMVPVRDGTFIGSFRNARSFTASDGKVYTWKLKSNGPVLRDNRNITIASLERSHSGFFSGNPSPATLSISEEGMPIIDEIVVTFVFVEQLNREEQW